MNLNSIHHVTINDITYWDGEYVKLMVKYHDDNSESHDIWCLNQVCHECELCHDIPIPSPTTKILSRKDFTRIWKFTQYC